MGCRFENSETLRMLSEKIPHCAQSSQRRMIKVAVFEKWLKFNKMARFNKNKQGREKQTKMVEDNGRLIGN